MAEPTLYETLQQRKQGQEHVMPEDEHAVMNKTTYTPVLFGELDFYHSHSDDSHTVVFIDGGNHTIYAASTLALSFVRVASSGWEKTTKKHIRVEEFIEYVGVDDDGRYVIQWFDTTGVRVIPFNNQRLETMRVEQSRAESIEQATEVGRRYLELGLAQEYGKIYDAVVIDGSLRSRDETERNLVKELCDTKATIVGFQKSTNVRTNASNTLHRLDRLTTEGRWMTSQLCITPEEPFSIHAVKLHEHSRYRFVVDVKVNALSQTELVSLLEAQSSDPLFFGYPYGLIDVDALARVQEQELQRHRILLQTLTGSLRDDIEQEATTQNAHEILDTMSF